MLREVAIVGAGWSGFRSISPDLSYKEMVYEAAVRAYEDAGIDPRRDVDSFVTVAEDFIEGTSIFDEYTPDQLGGALRPNHTITGDGIHGLAAAVMQILTGQFDVVVVEAHSKASNVLTLPYILAYAMDPVYNRPLAFHPYAIAGMEMRRYLAETATPLEACARVVVKNRANALFNPLAAYGADLSVEAVLGSDMVAEPLTRLQCADHADGAIVLVVADGATARALTDRPVWIRGIGWANDTHTLESRPRGGASDAHPAAQMAPRTARLPPPLQHHAQPHLHQQLAAGNVGRLPTPHGCKTPQRAGGGCGLRGPGLPQWDHRPHPRQLAGPQQGP